MTMLLRYLISLRSVIHQILITIVLVGRMNDSIVGMKELKKVSMLLKPLVSDRYENSLSNFNEMSVRQVLRMKSIIKF